VVGPESGGCSATLGKSPGGKIGSNQRESKKNINERKESKLLKNLGLRIGLKRDRAKPAVE